MSTIILVPTFTVLALGLIIATIVYVVTRVRSQQPLGLSLHSAMACYFYLISIISLVVMVLGLITVLNAGLSTVLGREFSYQARPVYELAPVPERDGPPKGSAFEQQLAERNRALERDFRNGLVQGASMAIVGGLVWGLHVYGRRRLEGRLLHQNSILNRAYLSILLAIFSIGGIIVTPIAVYDTLRYYLVEPVSNFDPRSAPGGLLAGAIVFIPFWVYYYTALVRQLRSNGRTANA